MPIQNISPLCFPRKKKAHHHSQCMYIPQNKIYNPLFNPPAPFFLPASAALNSSDILVAGWGNEKHSGWAPGPTVSSPAVEWKTGNFPSETVESMSRSEARHTRNSYSSPGTVVALTKHLSPDVAVLTKHLPLVVPLTKSSCTS